MSVRISIASLIFMCLFACSEPQIEMRTEFLTSQPPAVRELVIEAIERAEGSRRDAAAWGHLGHALHANRLLPQAIVAYERASNIDDDELEWSASRVVVLLKESRLEEAALAVTDAMDTGQDDPKFLFLAGSIYEQLGLSEDALLAYRSAAAGAPSTFEATFAIGRVLLNLGRYEEALPYLESAMASAPRSAEIRNALLRLSAAAPGFAVAIPSEDVAGDGGRVTLPLPYSDRLLPYVRTLDGLRAAAADMMDQNQPAAAEEMLYLLTRHYPEQMLPQEWMDIAHLQASRGDFRAAETAYLNCVQTHPEFSNAYLGLADLLFMKGDLTAARDYYGQAEGLVENDRQRARLHQGFGRIAARTGELETALGHMQSAAEAWPDSGLIQEDLARVLADLGRFDEAWSHLDRAEAIGHRVNPQFKRQLALVSPR